MDVMLALTEDGMHEVLWTQALLADWERVIVRNSGVLPPQSPAAPRRS